MGPARLLSLPPRKYVMLLRTCLVHSVTYRVQNMVWVIIGSLPPLFAIVAWLATYGGRHQIGGFTRGDIITYYLVVGVAWYIVGGRINEFLAREIKDGTLAQHLLKPYAALAHCILQEQAWKVVSFGLAMPVYAVLVVLFWHDIHLVETPLRLAFTAVATVLSATIFIVIEVSIGMLAFWTTNTRNLFEVYDLLLYLASGELVPLALFPRWAHVALTALPFRYTFSFPIEIFLGKLGASEVATGFLWQVGWLVILAGVARALWARGLRRFSATGM